MANESFSEIPSPIREQLEQDPTILKNLADPNFLRDIFTKVPQLAQANWCFFCGASRSAAPKAVSNPGDLTSQEIEQLGQRLLDLARTRPK